MPQSTINYTPEGWPYLDLDNYLETVPPYTTELADKLVDLETTLDDAATDIQELDTRIAGFAVIVANGRPDTPATMDSATQTKVAAAPSGSQFISLNRPQGAEVWRRRSTGWVCETGDTGWITITSWTSTGVLAGRALPAGAAPTTGLPGTVRVRRIGNQVTWAWYGISLTARAIWDIPWAGLRLTDAPYAREEDLTTNNQPLSATMGLRNVALSAETYPAHVHTTYGVDVAALTTEAWPSTTPASV